MSAQPKLRYTLEDYFDLERTSEARYEYWNGEVFDMSSVSHKHALAAQSLAPPRTLSTQLTWISPRCVQAMRPINWNTHFNLYS